MEIELDGKRIDTSKPGDILATALDALVRFRQQILDEGPIDTKAISRLDANIMRLGDAVAVWATVAAAVEVSPSSTSTPATSTKTAAEHAMEACTIYTKKWHTTEAFVQAVAAFRYAFVKENGREP